MNYEALKHQIEALTREVRDARAAHVTLEALKPKLLNWSQRASNLSKVAQMRSQPFTSAKLHGHSSAAFRARQSLATRQRTWGALEAQAAALVAELSPLIMLMDMEDSLPARVMNALQEAFSQQQSAANDAKEMSELFVKFGKGGEQTMTEVRDVSGSIPGVPVMPPFGQPVSVLLVISALLTLLAHKKRGSDGN